MSLYLNAVLLIVVLLALPVQSEAQTADEHNRVGFEEYFRGEYTSALVNLTKAIELKPNFIDAYYHRGLVYMGLKDYPKSIQDFSTLIQLRPSALWYYFRAQASTYMMDWNNAIADYTEAIRIHRGDIPPYKAHIGRADARFQTEDWQGALEDYSAAIRLYDTEPSAYLGYGRTLSQIGNHLGAQSSYREATNFIPENASQFYAQGMSYIYLGDTTRGCAALRASVNRRDHTGVHYADSMLTIFCR